VVLGASGDLAKKKTVRYPWHTSEISNRSQLTIRQFPALFGLVRYCR
jgi:glucose-6-phosphate 1-dehydrogenase